MRTTTTLPDINLFTQIESPIGALLLTSRTYRLTGLYFADRPHAPQIGPRWMEQANAAIFIRTARQVNEYTSGKRKQFDLPMDIGGTPFQQLVWQYIAAIPYGETISSSELARQVGYPEDPGAVAEATNTNPFALIIPCHRVVGENGDLASYSGGLPLKSALLDFEAGKSASLG